MKTSPRSVAAGLLLSLSFGALTVALAGCGKKEEAPPASSGYYTGPKAAKTPPAAGAAAKGGTEN